MQLTRSQQDALNIEKHVCVTAGAGSGKTTVLVERYLKILREGNVKTPREIVAITFTEKAAAEMKDRIIAEMASQEGDEESEQSNSLERFRDEMNSAHISTIHAFCSRILREFPFQAEVPANFSIVQGIEQKLLLQKTLKKTLKDIATNPGDPHRGELTHLLQRYGGQQKLVDFFSDLIDKRDILEHLTREIYDDHDSDEIRSYWRQSERIELIATINRLMSQIDIAKFILYLNAVLEVAKGTKVQEVKNLTQQLEEQHEQNPEAPEVLTLLRQIAKLITTTKDEIRVQGFLPNSIDRTGIATEIDFLVSTAKKIKNIPTIGREEDDAKKDDVETDNDDKTDTLETDEDFLISTTRDLFTLYTRTLNDYEKAKLSQGTLDFTDLQMKTRALLHKDEEIRQKLIKRHKYYMIDEYQDTNKLQHKLVKLLTNEFEETNIFIVGDPKQSIYGFRNADVRVFEQTKQQIIAKDGLDISLSENFRTLRDPVGFTNCFFDHLMGDGSENEFEVPYEALIQARQSYTDGNVDIILGKKDDETANEYALIAQHIKNMKANSIAVNGHSANGSGPSSPIEYGDIAILIQYRTHLPDIEHALLEAGIPYLTTKGVGFYQRQEIYDIWNYLNFLNEPVKNQASLAAILRGPAFGISDAELYEISLQTGESFWDKTQKYQEHSTNLKTAIDTLEKHSQIAHRMPVNQLIVTIVNETGMIGTLKTGIYGQQRWANYQKLLELARNFDGDENTQMLPDFIEFLDILIKEEPREGEAIIEESREAVQIMTIHAAKGKQFPIVILPCLDRRGRPNSEPFIDDVLGIGFSPLNPDERYRKTEPEIVTFMKNRANAKQIAEKKRLFYVGATRAEDRLILSGTLSDKGKADQILEWVHTHLGISEENHSLSLDVEQDAFVDNHTNHQHFQLQIPISRALADPASIDKISDATTPIEFPEYPKQFPDSNGIHASFSVDELANYARCPLRYQLENVLRIPTNGQGEMDPNETEMNAAVRYTLSRIRQQSDVDNLDRLIDGVSENYPEITGESEMTLRTHVSNFLNSGLGTTVFDASKTYTNQQIHADINGHIIEGRLDRLFKDETENWQVINYKIGEVQDLETCRPEMELYSLLLHRRYPDQLIVTINFFFTEHDRCEQMHFRTSQLQELQEQWQGTISALQCGNYKKNLEHCCSCPYADQDGQCIINES